MAFTTCLSPFDSDLFLNSLDRLFAEALLEGVFSGAGLLVAKPHLILFHKTWGQTHHGGSAVDGHTLFDLASLTKPLVTAPLCMRAVCEGKFALDDTLNRFFSLDILPTDKESITIRQLLSHSSGLPAYDPFYRELVSIEPSVRQSVLLRRILRTPLLPGQFPPTCYSDLGFMLLGMILEAVYGQPMEQLASDFLFKPLDLSLEGPCCERQTSPFEGNPVELETPKPPIFDGTGCNDVELSVPSQLSGGRKARPFGLGPGSGVGAGFTPARSTGLNATALTSPIKGEEKGAGFRQSALGFCRLRVSTDPTVPSESLNATRRVFAATEDCPWRKRLLAGEVHDENAYCLGGVAGHAGLFGTAHGVFDLLAFLWKVYRGGICDGFWRAEVVREFWTRQSAAPDATWMLGYDTPGLQNSSAGNYFSPRTPGHLGFTGTSFWFDLDREILVILLTNRVYPTRENERLKRFRPTIHNLVMETYHGTSKP